MQRSKKELGIATMEIVIILVVIVVFVGVGLFVLHSAKNNKAGITKAIDQTNTPRSGSSTSTQVQQ